MRGCHPCTFEAQAVEIFICLLEAAKDTDFLLNDSVLSQYASATQIDQDGMTAILPLRLWIVCMILLNRRLDLFGSWGDVDLVFDLRETINSLQVGGA